MFILAVFFVVVVELIYDDSYFAHIYYPQAFSDNQMRIVSNECSRIDHFTLECWLGDGSDGKLELKIRVSCHTDPITLGISQRSHTRGQVWQQVTIQNPQSCLTNRLYFPVMEIAK
jgi:hypothetical protein